MSTEQLLRKIEERTAVIGVIGLGYVGLPLAVEKAKAGYPVIGFDIQQKRVDMVNQGINYIGDVVDEDLEELVQRGQLRATSDYSHIRDVDAVAICVPTPLDKYQQPNISYVKGSAREIAKYLHPGMLVVLESTTYPGTTEEVVRPILEETGLESGAGYPSRLSPRSGWIPGNKVYNTQKHAQGGGGCHSGLHPGGGHAVPAGAGGGSLRGFQPIRCGDGENLREHLPQYQHRPGE